MISSITWQEDTGSPSSKWVVTTRADRLLVGVIFAFSFLVCYIIAIQYATRWSTMLKLKGEKQIQTTIAPKEEHRDPSVWYYMQHVAGGTHGIVVYAILLCSTPWFSPKSYDTVVCLPDPVKSACLVIVTDMLLYIVHRICHSSATLKALSGHHEHHQVVSPTAHSAIMGSLLESILVVWVPTVLAMNLLPFLTFTDSILALLFIELHLVSIHSDVCFVYDDMLDRLGFVTTKTHHVHHLKQTKNLGHVFWIWDYLGGTFLSWEEMVQKKRV
jgi:sterol desaturase/sphingolipid hydroxylase (fatty acid hydroxylase superfamily)